VAPTGTFSTTGPAASPLPPAAEDEVRLPPPVGDAKSGSRLAPTPSFASNRKLRALPPHLLNASRWRRCRGERRVQLHCGARARGPPGQLWRDDRGARRRTPGRRRQCAAAAAETLAGVSPSAADPAPPSPDRQPCAVVPFPEGEGDGNGFGAAVHGAHGAASSGSGCVLTTVDRCGAAAA